jgi:VanZ family protein
VKFVWLALLVGYCGFIFYLSHQSALPTPMLFAHQDKLFHATAYAILGFLAMGYFGCVLESSRQAFIIAMVFSALYGASDEWHQSFVVGRVADVFDWLADCVGAFFAINVTRHVTLMAKS